MAKIDFAFPVDKVHGKLAKSHKIGFAHRVASKLNYSTAYGVRSTAPTSKEIAHRKKFGEVAVQTTARLKDPMYIAADQAAFKAQTKYNTLRQYVFNVLLQEYETDNWQLTVDNWQETNYPQAQCWHRGVPQKASFLGCSAEVV